MKTGVRVPAQGGIAHYDPFAGVAASEIGSLAALLVVMGIASPPPASTRWIPETFEIGVADPRLAHTNQAQ